ncbi:hypothetical protein IWQ57_000051 [Coemansia nantahalensis]|uniref:Uncharacterized protein n=1 Tax=Coemansia nantahalensis TaxID=2789366 RepID=A0ACC1K923_9FUNG|nr:hypothetical protein IWQ57_000051 [Coemansia nantahalensis]
MELRNRQLTDEGSLEAADEEQHGDSTAAAGQATAAADSDVDMDECAFKAPDAALGGMGSDSDEHSDGDNDQGMEGALGGMNGGFLGDFEEIEEDEDVERFMSQNNTPTVSTRESPEARTRHPGSGPEMAAADGSDGGEEEEEEEEEEDSFETTSERTAAGTVAADGHSLLVAEPMDEDARVVPTQDSGNSGAPSWSRYLLPEDLARLTALQTEFRQSAIPKLPSEHLFLSPDVYRRYSVLPPVACTAEADKVAAVPEAPDTVAPAPAPPAPAAQKPSSLRSGGQQVKATTAKAAADSTGSANDVSSRVGDCSAADGAESAQPSASPRSPVPRRPRSKSQLGDEDDVVDTLLGAMGSGKPRASPPAAQISGSGGGSDAQQTIPDDMLVVMMAMEGGSVEAPAKTAKAAADGPAKAMAARLPRGYAGPFSQLTAEEHARAVVLAQRAKAKQLGAKEAADYQRLKAKADSEQQRFRDAAREKALPRLRHVAEAVQHHARREWSRTAAEALEAYPRMFAPVRVRAIRSSSSGYVQLVYKDTLFQTGACHHIADALSAPTPTLDVAADVDPWAAPPRRRRLPMSRDAIAADLAAAAAADVAISSSALTALLTLPQAFAKDVIIPFTVVDVASADGEDAPRRRVVLDKPLPPAAAATPRGLCQMFYGAAIRAQAGDADRPLELAGGSMAQRAAHLEEPPHEGVATDNANYTLWELGGLRVLIRYSVHGFAHGGRAADGAQPSKTTVTLATKVERQLGNTSPEALLAAGDGQPFEDVGEGERLAWWLSSYLRGNPSEVWVSHVDVHKSAIARVTRHTCADLYPPADAGGSGAQPSTRGVVDLLQDLLRLPPARYMLAHRRRTYDATIYKALENQDALAAATSQRTKDAVMDLAAELGPLDPADLPQGDVEADYVPVAWHGLPGQIPFTYAPADLEARCAAAASSAPPPWKGASAAARGRRRPGSKRKKAKHA